MSGSASPLRVLVVEDEALLAVDIEMTIEESGHLVVGEARCLQSALALAENTDPHLAFVDVQLARGTTGIDVSAMIQRRWPNALIVFLTANPARVRDELGGAHGIIAKPFSHKGLTDVLQFLSEGVFDPPPQTNQPACLTTTPEAARRLHG